MPRHWQVFERGRRAGFGLREHETPRAHIDPLQLQLDVVLEIPPARSIVEQLRQRVRESHLSLEDFARWVLGRAPRTLANYLSGGKIPSDARDWLSRLEGVWLQGECVVIVVRRGARGPRWPVKRKSRLVGGTE